MLTYDKKHSNKRSIEVLKEQVLKFISPAIANVLKEISQNAISEIEEIRLRSNRPLMIQNCHGDWFVEESGKLSKKMRNSYIVSQHEITKTLELMSQNSIYAYQDEIKSGFITLRGGHRIGICGKAVMEGRQVKNIKEISGLNIRISREIVGCSLKLISYIINGKNDVYNTLIVSPPQCGKTTMLRDISRALSDGMDEHEFQGIKVGIVDERSEIAACFKGVPQNRIGIRTDVLDACPKTIGMDLMIRSMSPQLLITDEIGNQGDGDAVMRVLNAGVRIITSAHGYNISELKSRQEVVSLLKEKVFERFVVLSGVNGPGTLEEVVDGTTMEVIYRRGLQCC